MKVPISIKLIVITVILLVGVTIPVAIKTSDITRSKLIESQEKNNIDLASAKSRELNHILNSLKEKIILNGRMLVSLKQAESATQNENINRNQESLANYQNLKRDFDNSFDFDPYLLSIEVIKFDKNSSETVISEKSKSIKEANIKFNKEELRKNPKYSKISSQSIREGTGKIILANSSVSNYQPIFTMGIPLVKENNLITHIVIADISLSVFQKTISDNDVNLFFITDSNGVLLGHKEEARVVVKQNFQSYEIVSFALNSPMATGMRYIKDPISKKSYYAAFAKTTYGPIVYSLIDEEKILEVTKSLNNNIIKILGYFLSATLLLIFLFSMSLTQPLEQLTELIGVVSKGNFNVKASQKVTHFLKDEVRELAVAFDQMTEGLKERDKVKNLFNKFHGSSVTEDLMKKDVSIGGQMKEVIVFFSDIRGFTAFSEKKKPEDVVKMLNEYFAVMVKIINSHGGIVDKFIGDAIMAVWGVPKSTTKDAFNAVKACLEMRKALADLNEKRLHRNESPIQIGMGLHAGSAISGTIGSEERMEYTIIGNTVNTGSRIESSTKAFGSDLLISDTVLEKIGDEFLAEFAGAAEVKGRSEPLKLHKIRGFKKPDGEYEIVITPYSDYEPEHADKVKIAS